MVSGLGVSLVIDGVEISPTWNYSVSFSSRASIERKERAIAIANKFKKGEIKVYDKGRIDKS